MYSPTISIKIETAEKIIAILNDMKDEVSSDYEKYETLLEVTDNLERSIATLEAH